VAKQRILDEIKRTAEENGGTPLGIDRFKEATGICKEDWYGIYWAKWSDSQVEAGFEPNRFGAEALDLDGMIEQIVSLTRALGQVPTKPECKMKERQDSKFPNVATIRRRLGTKVELIARARRFCATHDGWEDVAVILKKTEESLPKQGPPAKETGTGLTAGQVYMLRHNKVYKIGRSIDASRRYRDIRVQMPYETEEVHVIETDDTIGIEAYWHNRFREKRLEGEWFRLSAADVRAFKKRRFQ